MNDLLFNAVQALAFGAVFLAGLHSVFAVVSAWGLGAAVAALYGLRQYSVRPSVRGGGAFLRSRWQLSRWLAGERTASWGGSQLYLILAGVLLGPAALGGLKAAQGLMIGPIEVCSSSAGGALVCLRLAGSLPSAVAQGLVRVSRFVTGAGVVGSAACGIAVLLAAPTLLKLLYGAAFVTYAPAARIFAVSVMVAAFSTGPVLTLMTTRRVRPLLILNLAKVPFSVAAVCVLAALYGVTGAATTDLLTSVVTVVILLVLQSSARRSIEKAQTLPAMGFLEALRRRVVGNFNYLTGIWPASRGGSRRGNGVDLEVYPWGSRGAGAAPDVADHAQDYSTVHLIEADCSVPDDVTRH